MTLLTFIFVGVSNAQNVGNYMNRKANMARKPCYKQSRSECEQ